VLVITRFVWPLQLPLAAKIAAAVLLLVASQYHLWSKLSSGSVFAPEFPRALIILFNWAFGAMVFLAVMQLLLDAATLLTMLVRWGSVSVPDNVRYAMAVAAAVLAAIGVQQAIRVPPLHDIEIAIPNLPPQFDGYKMLQLTDLHISRLFPESWARAVVEKSNALGADLIVITGDLIDGSLAMRRDDVEPLRDLRAADGVYVIPGNHEYFFSYRTWMAHYAALGMRVLETVTPFSTAAAANSSLPASLTSQRAAPAIRSRISPRRLREHRPTHPSSCSTISRKAPGMPPPSASRYSSPAIPMAA